MPTTHNSVKQEPEHNNLQWAKVRKRAVLGQTTYLDVEEASAWQKAVLHQIELAVRSIDLDDLTELEEDHVQ